MSTPAPRLIVRVEKHGEHKNVPFGVYADERNEAVTRTEGHFSFDDTWYEGTRPATPEEEQTFTSWFEPTYGHCELVKRRTPWSQLGK